MRNKIANLKLLPLLTFAQNQCIMVHANESKCVSFQGVEKHITDNLVQHLLFINEKMETHRKAICPKTWREVKQVLAWSSSPHISVHCYEMQLGFFWTSH